MKPLADAIAILRGALKLALADPRLLGVFTLMGAIRHLLDEANEISDGYEAAGMETL